MEKPELTSKHVNLYAFSNGLNMIAQTVPTTYLTMFMTDYLHISPVALGTGMLIAKTVDFLVGLIAGIVIEKTNMKHGKYLSWIRLLTITLFFGNIVQMLDTTAFVSNATIRLIIVMVFYIMFHCSMNFLSSARASLIPRMAGADMDKRRMLTSRQAQAGAAVGIIGSATILPAVTLVQKLTGSESWGYFCIALLFSSCFVIVNLIFVKSAEGFDPPASVNEVKKSTVTVKQMVQSVVSNKQMLVLFFAFTAYTVGTQLYSGATAYYFRVTNSFSFMTVALTSRSICAFLASLAAPKIAKKLGKKNALLLGWGINAVCSLMIWKFSVRADGSANLYLMTFLMCFKQVAMYTYSAFTAIYWLDCGEYGYYTTGIDNRTMAVTVMNWPTKIGFAVGGSLVGYVLAWAGYQAPVGDAIASFAHMERFLIMIGLLPAIGATAAVLIVLFGYKLTDEQADEYARLNAEREHAAANS